MSELLLAVEQNSFRTGTDKATVYRNIGINYDLAKNYPQANVFYQKALTLAASMEQPDDKLIQIINIDLGYNAYNLQQSDVAIGYFEKTLAALQVEENKENLKYYYTAYGLSLAYYQQHKQNADVGLLTKAVKFMQISVDMILALRNEYVEPQDKLYLNSEGNVVFERLIEMLLRQNDLNRDDNLLKKCFVLSEQNKGMQLLEAIKNVDIGKASALADSIRRTNQSIKKLEANLKNAMHDTSNQQMAYWKSQLFEAIQTHEQLVFALKAQDPKYFKALYQPEIISVEAMQKRLSPEQALLEYFVGDSDIYLFVIRPDTYLVRTVKRDFRIEDWIKAFRESIQGYHMPP